MRVTAIAALSAAALLVTATPALAISDSEVAAARGSMITKAEAAKVGVKATASAFSLFESDRLADRSGDAHNTWLCDDASGNDVAVPASPISFTMERSNTRVQGVQAVTQTTYVYGSDTAAKAAYARLKTAAKRCSGTWSEADDGGPSITQTTSNGTSTVKDGDEVVWVLSATDSTGGGQAFASHDYNVYHRDGSRIVEIQIDRDGTGVAPITAAQRRAANEIACDAVHRS